MKRRALTSMLVLMLLAAALSGCGTPSDTAGTDSAAGADPYANVRPYAERALALATMQYGLAVMATVGTPEYYPPVDFGAFTLERHTVTWLGILGVEPSPALPPQGTVVTLRSSDGDGDGYAWAIQTYNLGGQLPSGAYFALSGAAGLGELSGDYDANVVSQSFDAAAEGGPLILQVTAPEGDEVARWGISEITQASWTQSPLAIEYLPSMLVDVEQQGQQVGRVELGYSADWGPVQATLEPAAPTGAGNTYWVLPSGRLTFGISEGATAYGPVELMPVVPAASPLLLDPSCSENGGLTAGLTTGKIYYLDPSGNAVALVTILGCGQYEVETFF